MNKVSSTSYASLNKHKGNLPFYIPLLAQSNPSNSTAKISQNFQATVMLSSAKHFPTIYHHILTKAPLTSTESGTLMKQFPNETELHACLPPKAHDGPIFIFYNHQNLTSNRRAHPRFYLCTSIKVRIGWR